MEEVVDFFLVNQVHQFQKEMEQQEVQGVAVIITVPLVDFLMVVQVEQVILHQLVLHKVIQVEQVLHILVQVRQLQVVEVVQVLLEVLLLQVELQEMVEQVVF